MKKRRHRLEATVAIDAATRVDVKAGIVYGVKILGFKSKHGYRYTERAMQQAIPLYEGVKVNVGHPDPRRPYSARDYGDRFGTLRGVVLDRRSGLRGNLHYNKAHTLARMFVYDARHDPTRLGLSHVADAPLKKLDGEWVCDSINKVISVDLVSDPATTYSLFESKGDRHMRVRRRPNLKQRLAKRLEGLNNREVRAIMEAADAMALPTDGEEQTTLAMKNMILAIFDDVKLSISAKLTKMRGLLKSFAEMVPGGVEGVDDGEAIDDAAAEAAAATNALSPGGKSSKGKAVATTEDAGRGQAARRIAKLESQLGEMDRRERARVLCESMGYSPTLGQLKAISRLPSKRDAKEMVGALLESQGDGLKRISGEGKVKSKGGSPKPVQYTDDKQWAHGLSIVG